MDDFVREWWVAMDKARSSSLVALQGFFYGVCCWIQDGSPLPLPTLEEFMDFSEGDMSEYPLEDCMTLYSYLNSMESKPLLKEEELEEIVGGVCKEASIKIPTQLFILQTLLEGEPISEEQHKAIQEYSSAPSQELLSSSFVEQQQLQQPELQPQPQPQKMKPLFRKMHMTRRTHGRRAITPIKRRHGHRVSSRHKTRISTKKKESKQLL